MTTTNQKDSSAKAMADTVQRLQGEPAAAVAKLSQDSSATSGCLDKLEALANAGAPVALRAETLRDLIDLARRATPAPQAATPLPEQDEHLSSIVERARLATDNHCESLPFRPSKAYSNAYFYRLLTQQAAPTRPNE